MEKYQKFNDVINGFSPSFARILLERLKEEKKEVVQGVGMDKNFVITPFLGVILYHLRSQVFVDKITYPQTKKGREVIELILDTIDATEEFLTLFEDKKNKKFITNLGPEIEEISKSEELVKKISKFGEKGILE